MTSHCAVLTNPEHDLLVVDGRRLTEPHRELGLVALNVLRHSHLVFLQFHATLYEGITLSHANMYENVVVIISRNARVHCTHQQLVKYLFWYQWRIQIGPSHLLLPIFHDGSVCCVNLHSID